MLRDARIVAFQVMVLDPIDDIPMLRRPTRMGRPARPLFARPLGNSRENDCVVTVFDDARIEYANDLPIWMTGIDILRPKQQVCGKTFNHRSTNRDLL